MAWTREHPTREGYYWFMPDDRDQWWYCTLPLIVDCRNGYLMVNGDERSLDGDELAGLWSPEPLVPPAF